MPSIIFFLLTTVALGVAIYLYLHREQDKIIPREKNDSAPNELKKGRKVTSVKKINFLFIILPIIGAVISYSFFNLLLGGAFQHWIFLGASPTGKAIKVVWVDGRILGNEYVETDLGETYHLQHDYNDPSNIKWTKLKQAPSSQSSNYFEVGQVPLEECNPYILPSLKKFVDSKIVCNRMEFTTYLQVTAIDNTGKVYAWKKEGGLEDQILVFLSPCLGAILGFSAIILLRFYSL
jgi:hypothetical protein